MKILRLSFSILGFFFEIGIPLILFGGIIPYTYNGIAKSLTTMGYIAVCVFIYFAGKKIKEKILERPKSLWRALILSSFPIVIWIIINLGIGWMLTFIDDISLYWNKVIIFIIIGRLFYTVEETLAAEEIKNERSK